jgi:hypothetical protein
MYMSGPVYFIWPWKSSAPYRTIRDFTPGSLSAADTCILYHVTHFEAFRRGKETMNKVVGGEGKQWTKAIRCGACYYSIVLNAHRVTSMADTDIDAVRTDTRKNDRLSSNTCDMYMGDLRHIHDPVLSSLKMEGIRLLFLIVEWFRHVKTVNLKFVCTCIITIQINQPTRCNNFPSLLIDVYLQLNTFRASSRPLSGAQQLHYQPLVLPSEHGGSSAAGRGRADHSCSGRAVSITYSECMSVCGLRYPACNARAQYFHMWPASCTVLLSHYLVNRTISKKK